MAVYLTDDDLRQLAEATRLLVSPFDHETVDGWRSAVNRRLIELLDADSAGFMLPVSEGLVMYSDEHDPAALAQYPERPPPDLGDGTPIAVRMLALGVSTLEHGYGEDYTEYLGSEYYNEYAGANGAHDTLAATNPLIHAETGFPATLQLWHSSPTGRRFGDREVALLRLLFPAFRAGVESYLRWGSHREDIIGVSDALDQATLVCGLDGEVLHMTPSLKSILAEDPDAAAIRSQMKTAVDEVRSAATGRKKREKWPTQAIVRTIRTRRGAYRLTGCLIGRRLPGRHPLAVVGLDRLHPRFPSKRELQERFGLTPRQADVARLLAERLSNQEIADRLIISPHTALRHTEAVMAKLGVSDRREIPGVLAR